VRLGQVVGYGVILCVAAVTGIAQAQSDPPGIPHFAAVVHQLALKVHDTGPASDTTGIFPLIIPQVLPNPDPTGTVETFNTDGPTDTATNAFFESLGTNGRACATCHEPRSAWGVSAASIQDRFDASDGTDPIFRVVDGANCPSADVSTLAAKRDAYSLLLSKGVIRIFLPLPATRLGTNPPLPRDYEVTVVSDPYGCTTLSSNPPMISVYRRPLPSANLRFLTECPSNQTTCAPLSIMWDGREPSFQSQSIDATLGHAQALNPPTSAQVAQIINFDTGIFDAQEFDNNAGNLHARQASGGPAALSQQEFFIGINDVLSPGFTPDIFSLYIPWENVPPNGRNEARAAVARGEILFNSKPIPISGVNGLNLFASDPLGANPIVGTCGTCHDSPNVGNHSKKLPINIGIADAAPPVLDVSGLPVFTVKCTETTGPLKGQTFTVTDLGRALISGNCADVGKVKGPILRGLSARAPYFHNGSAATFEDVVNFYDQRFGIGFTDQEKADLVAFLQTL
jgi:cytochrome c peroxidase